jgi:hypothetical protein
MRDFIGASPQFIPNGTSVTVANLRFQREAGASSGSFHSEGGQVSGAGN